MKARKLLVDVLLRISILFSRGSGLFTALAIGACDEQELHERTTAYWDDLEELQTEGHTCSGLMRWEHDVYERFLPGTGKIGLIGCGTGRDLLPLARLGYTMDGVDSSVRCIERARQTLEKLGVEAGLYLADISSFRFPREPYEAIIFSWYLYAYLAGSSRRVAILARLGQQLQPGGRILLSIPKRALISSTPSQKVSRWMARLTLNPTPPGELDYYLIRHQGGGRLMWMREFTREQIADEAARAGLDLLHWQEYEEEDEPIGIVLGPARSTERESQ